MSMTAIAHIDPGMNTGVAIFDLAYPGFLLEIGTIKDNTTLVEYMDKLQKMKYKHSIEIACIEAYQNFGRRFYNAAKVQQQIRACQDVFPVRIMIKTGQWNPRHFKDQYKRMLAAAAFNRAFTNSHTTDAAMMGNWFASWVMSWARVCKIKPDEMARIIADKFGCIPKRGELQVWADKYNQDQTPKFVSLAHFM